ncbi:hypothetical protein ABIF72_003972 [Bradyrhizobium japonicum]
MFNLDAFVIRGHEKVIGHYRRMRDSASSELERRSLQRRIEEESAALERYLKTRLRRVQAVA